MNKLEEKTVGVENHNDFSKVVVSPLEETPKEVRNVSDEHDETNQSGWAGFPRSLMSAVKDDFLTSAFVLILLGYVIIETFGKDGINFKEYIWLSLSLFILYKIFKTSELYEGSAIYLFSRRVANILNRKIYAVIILALLIIDILFNHPFFIDKFIFIFKKLFP